jgi:hypothetical protein
MHKGVNGLVAARERFLKALLKVNTIAQEFERVCEVTQNLELLAIVKQIPQLTLKYVVTSQSLYI